jgi:hypothetical protein
MRNEPQLSNFRQRADFPSSNLMSIIILVDVHDGDDDHDHDNNRDNNHEKK